MENIIEVITDSLNGIRIQFIENNSVYKNLSMIQWIGLESKIIILQEIALKLITDDELLREIENTKNLIVGLSAKDAN